MDKKDFTKNFRKSLLLNVSAGLLLVCLLVAFLSIFPLYKQLLAKQEDHLFFTVKAKKMIVENFLDKAKETALQITSRSRLRDALEDYNSGRISIDFFEKFSAPKLRDAMTISEEIKSIVRFDKSDKPVVAVGMEVPESIFPNLSEENDEATVHGPFSFDGEGQSIAIRAPILNRQQQRLGTDLVFFSISQVRSVVEDYDGLGESGEIILGMVAEGKASLFFPMRQHGGEDHRLKHSIESVLQTITLSAANPEGLPRKLVRGHTINLSDRIEGAEWTILYSIHKDEVYGPVNVHLMVIGLALLCIIGLGVFGMAQLLKPLADKAIIRIDTLSKEIDGRRQAEENLRESENRYRNLLETSPLGIQLTDPNGIITFSNRAHHEILGYREGELIGKGLWEMQIDAEKAEELRAYLKSLALEQPPPKPFFTTNRRPDGRLVDLRIDWDYQRDRKGKVCGFVSIITDITESRKREEEQRKIQRLESIGVLAGGIAHDFNNLLTGILGNISLGLQDEGIGEETRKMLNDARKASQQAVSLTRQLLTFSRGGAPMVEVSSLQEIIREAAEFVLHGGNVFCSLDLPEDLWLVNIDRGQIAQVVQNIVLNARHAMPQGGEVTVKAENLSRMDSEPVAMSAQKPFVKISIKDRGPGIAADKIDKIFDPYYTTKSSGSGLGLAICLSIVNKHDGHLAVHSEPGGGTEFMIYLPAVFGKEEKCNTTERMPGPLSPLRILLMDDEPLVRDVGKAMLRMLGQTVVLAEDGAEAVSLYRQALSSTNPFSLVITDLTVPGGMGGVEAASQILALHPKANIVVSSGYSNDPVLAHYRDYGFCAAVGKPYELEELNQVLHEVVVKVSSQTETSAA